MAVVTARAHRIDVLTGLMGGALLLIVVGFAIAAIGWSRTAAELETTRTELSELQQAVTTAWPYVERSGVVLQPEDMDR